MMKGFENRGYTLIELLVVISIGSIFFFFTLAAYQAYNKSQVLRTTAAEIEVLLRDAQNRALSGEKGVSCRPIGNCNFLLKNWQFVWGGNQYTMKGVCFDSNGKCLTDVEFSEKTFTLPTSDNLRFTSSGTVKFGPLTQRTDVGGGPSIVVCLTSNSGIYKITIWQGGDIVNEGKVTSCP